MNQIPFAPTSLLAAALLALPLAAQADPPRRTHARTSVDVHIGVPLPRGSIYYGYGRPYYGYGRPYPYYNYYPRWYGPPPVWYVPPPYYPPAVVTVPVPTQPPVYIEQAPGATQPQQQAQPQQGQYWYYCAESNGYYPYVKECPGGWMAVAPQPAR